MNVGFQIVPYGHRIGKLSDKNLYSYVYSTEVHLLRVLPDRRSTEQKWQQTNIQNNAILNQQLPILVNVF